MSSTPACGFVLILPPFRTVIFPHESCCAKSTLSALTLIANVPLGTTLGSIQNKSKHILVVVDAFKKCIELYPVNTTSTKEVCAALHKYLSAYSRPAELLPIVELVSLPLNLLHL